MARSSHSLSLVSILKCVQVKEPWTETKTNIRDNYQTTYNPGHAVVWYNKYADLLARAMVTGPIQLHHSDVTNTMRETARVNPHPRKKKKKKKKKHAGGLPAGSGGRGRLQAKRWETRHNQCDVTSYISDFQNGAHFCCSLSSHKNGNFNGLADPVPTFYINPVSEKRVRHVCNDIRRLGKFKSFKSRMNTHYRAAVMSAQCVLL